MMTCTARNTGIALVALLISVAGCSASPGQTAESTPPPEPTASTPDVSPAALSPPAEVDAYAVGFRTVTVIDSAAATPARGPLPARRDRVLTTSVWYPAAQRGGAVALPGPYPLVVFAHGFDVAPQTYTRLLRQVAAAGFVVAAPRFPISASNLPGRPREDDMANQALDVRSTITTMLAKSADHGWLAGRLNGHEVAVIGHSDGGETVAANVLVAADHDRHIKAAVILAGQLPTWGVFDPAPIPTLVVQGSADTINPPSLSRDLYARLSSPKWYLDVLGATHLPAIIGSDTRARAVRRIVVAFLDATLRQDPNAHTLFIHLGHEQGTTQLTTSSP